MKRARDWAVRLDAYIAAGQRAPFRRGRNDCCLFACGAIAAMTGVDPGAWFRGRYASAFGARFMLRQFAGGGLEEAVDKLAAELEAAEIPALSASRGDLCLAGSLDGISGLGICLGPRAAFMTPAGLAFVPITRVKRAWRI